MGYFKKWGSVPRTLLPAPSQKVTHGRLWLFQIHQVNRVNSLNGCAIIKAHVALVLLLLFLQSFLFVTQ